MLKTFSKSQPGPSRIKPPQLLILTRWICWFRTPTATPEALAAKFELADPANERFFGDGKPGHRQFDLEGYVAHRLAMAGISRVEALGIDTYADRDTWFSYRRATHRGEADYGRQIALIGVRG